MVQYAIIQHFDQKLQKPENFYLDTIFKVKHCMVSYISIFIAGGREYPAVRVEYKMASERYLVAEI